MARKNGQNHDIESIYEPNIKSARYGEQEERVLARIIAKIKEFILYYEFTEATIQRRENQEILHRIQGKETWYDTILESL